MLGGAGGQDKTRTTGGAKLARGRYRDRMRYRSAQSSAPMAKPSRIGDLDSADNIEFQRRAWMFQRASWVAIALIVAAAMAGLFGSGALAKARVEASGLEIEYERFLRRHVPAELVIRVRAVATSSAFRLRIDNAYLRRVETGDIVPPPARREGGRKWTAFVFEAPPPGGLPDR